MSEPVQTDIASEILGLASAKVVNGDGPKNNVDSPVVSAPAVPQPSQERFQYVGRIPPAHKKLLDQGVHPRDIPHISHGVWRTRNCQCYNCKKSRGEVLAPENSSSASPSGPTDPHTEAVKALIDEEVAGMIFDIPRKTAELIVVAKDLPADVRKIWERSAKEQDALGRLGKAAIDSVQKIPDFKYKEWVILGAFEGAHFSSRLTATLLMVVLHKRGELKK